MGEKINYGRVILGGVVAGIVAEILGIVVDGVLLAPQWAAGMKALGRAEFSAGQDVAFGVMEVVLGVFMIWLYAAIRPRYGAGPKTAVCAGVAIWFAGVLLPNIGFMWVGGLFPPGLTVMTSAGGIVELVAGALAGAALYKESEPLSH
jgi:hypothetical protein